jgi:hypothetical protein
MLLSLKQFTLHMLARANALAKPDEDFDRIMSTFQILRDDWAEKAVINQRMAERATWLTTSLKAANSRANKYACLALLGFGLIAIEAHAVTLYFLPR